MNGDWRDIGHFLDYLGETLIPDLRESGFDATADDFEDAVEFIRELEAKQVEQRALISDLTACLDRAVEREEQRQ